ncbi:GntR family transcriptional regulator [Angustibacter aerolatus]
MPSDRSTTAERVAEALRHRITDGDLRPGAQLSEERLGADLGVSRNTLREAFRLLGHDGLLVHHLHRGVFVATLEPADLVDLYRLRRLVECDAVRGANDPDAAVLALVAAEVDAADAAVAADDWTAVGTANMHFHQRLVQLAGSPRTDALMRRLLAELRLVFHVVASPRELHERYVRQNRALLEQLQRGDAAGAADELGRYLDDSQHQLLAAYRARSSPRPIGRLDAEAVAR